MESKIKHFPPSFVISPLCSNKEEGKFKCQGWASLSSCNIIFCLRKQKLERGRGKSQDRNRSGSGTGEVVVEIFLDNKESKSVTLSSSGVVGYRQKLRISCFLQAQHTYLANLGIFCSCCSSLPLLRLR